MNTTENNKLIAEFMGVKTETFRSGNLNFMYNINGLEEGFEAHELSYETSWDWLMPVIENIKEFNHNRRIILHRFSFGLNYVAMKIELNRRFFDKERMVNNDFLEQTYDLVVEFIKWYNEQEK